MFSGDKNLTILQSNTTLIVVLATTFSFLGVRASMCACVHMCLCSTVQVWLDVKQARDTSCFRLASASCYYICWVATPKSPALLRS